MNRQDTPLVQYLTQVIAGEQSGLIARLVLLLLTLLEGVYWLLLQLHRLSTRPRRLPVPVLSIGNLVAGGTGKTPTVVWLAKQLQAAGYHPAVLTRGYGGKAQEAGMVFSHSDLEQRLPEHVGDEPYLIAKLLPDLTVAVGRDRYAMGRRALAGHSGIDCFILDDGLQYWGLQRDLDIILLDARRPFDNGHLIPRGILREPVRGLRRGKVILLTRTQHLASADLDQLTTRLKQLNPEAQIGMANPVEPEVVAMEDWDQGKLGQPANRYLKGRRIGIATAIGNPEQLLQTIRAFEPVLEQQWLFPDHYHWSEAAIAELIQNINSVGLKEIIVTAKDAVKLNGYNRLFQQAGLKVLILTLDFTVHPPNILEQVLVTLQKKG